MPSLLGLPPITPELKSISPYLQRADELKSQEPTMAYWCAYYAAQIGISLKARDTPSRDLLFSLLGTLEHMKRDIGPNDAIDVESASSAYVENFALRVFAMADNDDRGGHATRSTAKKFLAAANFLEVLKIFPKSEISESNDEKIRYAKWKAADIAKAFREGRKPTPGPADSGLDVDQGLSQFAPQDIHDDTAPATAPHLSSSTASPPFKTSQLSTSPPHIKRLSNSSIDHADIIRANQKSPPGGSNLIGVHGNGARRNSEGDATPGSWSTAATPGTAIERDDAIEMKNALEIDAHERVDGALRRVSPTEPKTKHRKSRSGSGSSSGSGSGGGVLKKAWVSEELENPHVPHGNGDTTFLHPSNGNGKKFVHFTPSVDGGLSSAANSPISPIYNATPVLSLAEDGGNFPERSNEAAATQSTHEAERPASPVFAETLPAGFVPTKRSTNLTPPVIPAPSSPSQVYYAASHPSVSENPPSIYHLPPPPLPPAELELTPSIIAKAQKHCRFAISALDYEDGEQARRELRAALAALGG